MSECMRVLRQEHVNLSKLLNALEHQLDLFDSAGATDYEVIEGVVDYCLTCPDVQHHPLEDMVFQKLRERDPAAAKAVGNLVSAHESLSALTHRLADVVRDVLMEARVSREGFYSLAREFLDSYRYHMRMEEEHFFPTAERLLSEEDWQDIDAHLSNPQDPLFGDAVEARFSDLRDYLITLDRESPAP